MSTSNYFLIKKSDDNELEGWSLPTIEVKDRAVVGYCSYDKDYKMTFDLTQVPYYHKQSSSKVFFDLNEYQQGVKDNFIKTKLDEFLRFIIHEKEKNKIEGNSGNVK